LNKKRSLFALDWAVFFMADVETGIGPFVSTYLSVAFHLNPAQIGWILGSQSLASILVQTPAGWLIDQVRRKPWLLAGVAVIISCGALIIVSAPSVALQITNQIVIGAAAAFVSPTIAAISLGLVGRPAFSGRVGRNAAFSHGGNVATALFAGYLGYLAGQRWIFFVSAGLGAAVVLCTAIMRNQDIDNDVAREKPSEGSGTTQSIPGVFKTTRIGLFTLVVILFHMANAAMLPLAGQELVRAKHGASSLYMAACIVTAQLVMVPVSYLAGRNADRIGRKPLLLAAFAILALRGLLFALGQRPLYIVGVEVFDGFGTALAGVVSLLIVSDLAKGTGRFTFMQGVMQTAVGIGAFLGNSLAGMVAKTAGFPVAFSMLATIAVLGCGLYAFRMPETK